MRMMQGDVVAGRARLSGTFSFVCNQMAIAVVAGAGRLPPGAGRLPTGGLASLPALRAFLEKGLQRVEFAPSASGVAGSRGSLAWAQAETLY